MSCSTILQFLFLVSVVFFPLGPVSARPANVYQFDLRQDKGSPTTLVTTQTSQAMTGPVIQTCTITLTPVTDSNGNSVVQEVTSCTVTTDADSGAPGSSPTPSSTTATSSSTTSSSTVATSSPTAVPSPTSTSVTSSDSSSSNTTASPNKTPGAEIPATTLVIPSAPSSAPSAAPSATVGGTAGSNPKAAAGVSNGSAAGDATASPGSSFTLPGKHLSVLPIGLGVFAGISVIALIVVGLVTYERTKYRKAFRQRKLAEAGTAMGYGGMAQRTP